MTENRSDFVIENLNRIKDNISNAAIKSGRNLSDIRIMAVTKTVAPELVNVAIENGIDLLGENRVQEFLDKKDNYLQSAEVQFIGNLQTNKVKYIINNVSMIQSVNSIKLAKEINRLAQKNSRVMDILLEINIGSELTKQGIDTALVFDTLYEIAELPFVCVKGLMAIPPICEEKSESLKYFSQLKQLSVDIDSKNIDNVYMKYLSMGMSQDYEAAVEMGSNIVRIGSALFGQRIYK